MAERETTRQCVVTGKPRPQVSWTRQGRTGEDLAEILHIVLNWRITNYGIEKEWSTLKGPESCDLVVFEGKDKRLVTF